MHVLVLMGSRNPEGQTGSAAKAYLEGLEAGGATYEQVWLLHQDIQMCIQRGMDGFGNCLAEGACKIDDGFAALVDKLRAADALAIITPVYWGDLSEITQAFIDRLRRICLHENGIRGIKGKPAMGVCVAGGGGGGSVNCADSLQRALGHCYFDVVDMVPCRRQTLDLKLEVLKVTGRWFARYPVPAKT